MGRGLSLHPQPSCSGIAAFAAIILATHILNDAQAIHPGVFSMTKFWPWSAHRRDRNWVSPRPGSRRVRGQAEALEARLALTTLPAGFTESLVTTNSNLSAPTA